MPGDDVQLNEVARQLPVQGFVVHLQALLDGIKDGRIEATVEEVAYLRGAFDCLMLPRE